MSNSTTYPTDSNEQTQTPTDVQRTTAFEGLPLVRSRDAFGTTNEGSLPPVFDNPNQPKTFNIVGDYPWTLSDVQNRFDIPNIRLVEHRINQNMLQRQAMFYVGGGVGVVGDIQQSLDNLLTGADQPTSQGLLDVYTEMYPDNPTGFRYVFPYFSKTQFELNTPQWSQVDSITESLGEAGASASSALKNIGSSTGRSAADLIDAAGQIGKTAMDAVQIGLKAAYPVVGIVDRPRIFTNHSERSVTISFPLYNTIRANDWINNFEFYFAFASQNLFGKRNFITGQPPVFYRVFVPGQYFSFASCVTNFTVENLGNVRRDFTTNGQETIVPDAYQITITLTEMLMPSLNQYNAIISGDAQSKVQVGVPGY